MPTAEYAQVAPADRSTRPVSNVWRNPLRATRTCNTLRAVYPYTPEAP